MDRLKLFRYIALGVTVGLVLTASVYGIQYFNARIKEINNKLANSEPKIIIPTQTCDVPANTVKNRYSITIRSGDIDKIKKSTEELIANARGTAITANDATYSIYEDKLGQTTLEREVQFFVLLPQDQSKNFIAALKKLGNSPNVLESENTTIDTADNIETICQSTLESIRALREQEKIYLDQLQQQDISFEKKQEISNELARLRQDAASSARSIENLNKNLDKFETTITIREILG